MFGWFAPKCPLDTYEKTWTERRMLWLADRFGIERLRKAKVVLPTDDFFPGQLRGQVEDPRLMLERVSEYLGVDVSHIELKMYPDVQLPGAAGHYAPGEQTVIRVAESQLQDPIKMIATLAHELAHEMLLGGGVLAEDVQDHEWVTDLLPAFLGMGIFAANSCIQESYESSGRFFRWSIGRQGYLPAHIFGYAFALFAFMRDEQAPEWATHLRLDAADVFRKGLRYLQKTNDSLFHPETICAPRVAASDRQWIDRLRTGTSSVRLDALWEIAERGTANQDVVTAVSDCLADRNATISGHAGRTLASLGAIAAPVLPQLIEALVSGHDAARQGAARALGVLRLEPQTVVPELCMMLDDTNRGLVTEAADALSCFGRDAEQAAPQLLSRLTRALVECNHDRTGKFIGALVAVTSDPERSLLDHFEEGDLELRRRALDALRNHDRGGARPPSQPGPNASRRTYPVNGREGTGSTDGA